MVGWRRAIALAAGGLLLLLSGHTGCGILDGGSEDDPMSTSVAPSACSSYPPQSTSRYVLPYTAWAF